MLALIVLRYKEPKLPRPYKVNSIEEQQCQSNKYLDKVLGAAQLSRHVNTCKYIKTHVNESKHT